MALPTWVPGDETKPAPGSLLVVQAFVNTWEADTGVDFLAAADRAVPWLVAAGLLSRPIEATPDELRGLRDVREALRAVLEENGGGGAATPEQLALLGGAGPDRVAGAGTAAPGTAAPADRAVGLGMAASGTAAPGTVDRAVGLGMGPDRQVRIEPPDVPLVWAVTARLLIAVRDAQLGGTWGRLKACHNDECRWAYYDRSHSQRGRWCDMAVCGNRVKNRALRARQTPRRGEGGG
jgi:CGNR zinc finger/Putative stress-induced transcription regulator